MKYGISFKNDTYFSFALWLGKFVYRIYPKSAKGWFLAINYTNAYPPDHYSKEPFFIGIETDEEYPCYKD